MDPYREAIRDDLEAQFELPNMPPPTANKPGKGFACIPNGYAHCEKCRSLGLYALFQNREERDPISGSRE